MLSPLFPVPRNQLQRPPIYEQFCVMWHGRCSVTFCCVSSGGEESLDMNEIAERVNILKKEVAQLENEERRIDQDRIIVDHYLQLVTRDVANDK